MRPVVESIGRAVRAARPASFDDYLDCWPVAVDVTVGTRPAFDRVLAARGTRRHRVVDPAVPRSDAADAAGDDAG
jgi:hypothetical protein